jgi:acetyl-CoA acetyltransferase
MREVAILGIGQIKIDEHWEKSLREIGGEAAFAAMQDAGMEKVDSLYVGNMLSPARSLQIGSGCGSRKRSRLKRPVDPGRRRFVPR